MKHRITSYSKEQRDDLHTSSIEEQTTEAASDAEATTAIQHLRRHGRIVTSWTQHAEDGSQNTATSKRGAS